MFYTGRSTSTGLRAFSAGVGAFLSGGLLFSMGPPAGLDTGSLAPYLITGAIFAFCAFALVAQGLTYARNALIVTPDGLYFRNWRSSRFAMPWSDLKEVAIESWLEGGGGGRYVTRGMPFFALYLLTTGRSGEPEWFNVATDASRETVARIAELLALRAGLVYVGDVSPRHEAWRRPDSTARFER